VTFEPWDVVVVPFPFVERPGVKRRPALVLSRPEFHRSGHCLLAMITSAGHSPWLGDTPIEDLEAAGLSHRCLVRFKLFTLDNRLIVRAAGRLGATDRAAVTKALGRVVAT
jgi:mRNA interferase MazF